MGAGQGLAPDGAKLRRPPTTWKSTGATGEKEARGAEGEGREQWGRVRAGGWGRGRAGGKGGWGRVRGEGFPPWPPWPTCCAVLSPSLAPAAPPFSPGTLKSAVPSTRFLSLRPLPLPQGLATLQLLPGPATAPLPSVCSPSTSTRSSAECEAEGRGYEAGRGARGEGGGREGGINPVRRRPHRQGEAEGEAR